MPTNKFKEPKIKGKNNLQYQTEYGDGREGGEEWLRKYLFYVHKKKKHMKKKIGLTSTGKTPLEVKKKGKERTRGV